MSTIEGRTVVITGAGSGIGFVYSPRIAITFIEPMFEKPSDGRLPCRRPLVPDRSSAHQNTGFFVGPS